MRNQSSTPACVSRSARWTSERMRTVDPGFNPPVSNRPSRRRRNRANVGARRRARRCCVRVVVSRERAARGASRGSSRWTGIPSRRPRARRPPRPRPLLWQEVRVERARRRDARAARQGARDEREEASRRGQARRRARGGGERRQSGRRVRACGSRGGGDDRRGGDDDARVSPRVRRPRRSRGPAHDPQREEGCERCRG